MKHTPGYCAGMTVMVWEDPISRMKLEGAARLIRRINPPDAPQLPAEGLECWEVCFGGGRGEPTVQRFIGAVLGS